MAIKTHDNDLLIQGYIQPTTIELGHASDTTLSRVSAGVIAVEGKQLSFSTLNINSQTGTSYTLATTDESNTLIRMNNAAAITLNLPLNSNVAIAIGSVISVEQQGAGIVTVTPLSTVTVNTTARKTWGQNAVIQLIKVGTDVWNVINATV